MTTVARRTFLIGLASVIGAPALAKPSLFVGEIVLASIKHASPRRLTELTFSSMPMGDEWKDIKEDPVQYTFYRNDEEIKVVTLNPRATFRWVFAMGHEYFFDKCDVLRMHVEPCHTVVTLDVSFDLELDMTRPPRPVTECYRWLDGKSDVFSVIANDPRKVQVNRER